MSEENYDMQEDEDIEMDVSEDEMNDEPPTRVEPPVEEDAALARRRAIQDIMRDNSISDQEKRMRIQNLMSGGRTEVAPPPAPVLPAAEANAACVHYERNCNIVAPCCNRVFGCRICHDELSPNGHLPMNRFMVREVVCKNCSTRQAASNQCIHCQTIFGEYHCGLCNLWMSMVSRKSLFSNYLSNQQLIYYRPKSPSTVTNVAFAEWVGWRTFGIVTNVACALASVSLKATSASRTSIKIIVLSAEKTCLAVDRALKICRVAMPFMPTASANWLDLTIVAPFARRRLSVNRAWRLLGKLVPGTLLSTPCQQISSAQWISCATIVRQSHQVDNGIFLVSSAQVAAASTLLWSKF